MELVAIPDVAGMRDRPHGFHEGRAAFLLGQRPCGGLVEAHERRVHGEAGVHAQIEGHLHGLDRVVAAVGIAGKIGFADAHDQMADALAPGQRRRRREENEVAARHEGVGNALLVEGNLHVAGHGGFPDLVEEPEREDGVLPEPGGPLSGKIAVGAHRVEHVPAAFHFDVMALAVVETDRQHAGKAVQGPAEAGCGVLPAGEDDEGRSVDAVHGKPS